MFPFSQSRFLDLYFCSHLKTIDNKIFKQTQIFLLEKDRICVRDEMRRWSMSYSHFDFFS